MFILSHVSTILLLPTTALYSPPPPSSLQTRRQSRASIHLVWYYLLTWLTYGLFLLLGSWDSAGGCRFSAYIAGEAEDCGRGWGRSWAEASVFVVNSRVTWFNSFPCLTLSGCGSLCAIAHTTCLCSAYEMSHICYSRLRALRFSALSLFVASLVGRCFLDLMFSRQIMCCNLHSTYYKIVVLWMWSRVTLCCSCRGGKRIKISVWWWKPKQQKLAW